MIQQKNNAIQQEFQNDENKLRACVIPTLAVETLLSTEDSKIEFQDFQRPFINAIPNIKELDPTRLGQENILFAGRTSGKTQVCFKYKILYLAVIRPEIDKILYGLKEPLPCVIILTGNAQSTASRLGDMLMTEFKTHPILSEFIDPKNLSKSYIRLKNNTEIFIQTIGNDGSALRGHNGKIKQIRNHMNAHFHLATSIHVFCDEIAHTHTGASNIIYDVFRPMMNVGEISTINLATTPDGTTGEAYEAFMGARNCYDYLDYNKAIKEIKIMHSQGMEITDDMALEITNKHIVKFNDRSTNNYIAYRFPTGMNKYNDRKALQIFKHKMLASGKKQTWRQEYLAIPSTESDMFFNDATWKKCIDYDKPELDENSPEVHEMDWYGERCLGIDPALGSEKEGKGDYWGLTVVNKKNYEYELLFSKRYRFKKENALEDAFEKVIEIIRLFRVTAVRYEAGLLEALYHMLNRYFKAHNISIDSALMPNSNNYKNKVFVGLKTLMNKGSFVMPYIRDLDDERKTFVNKGSSYDGSKIKLDHEGAWGINHSDLLLSLCASLSYWSDALVRESSEYEASAFSYIGQPLTAYGPSSQFEMPTWKKLSRSA